MLRRLLAQTLTLAVSACSLPGAPEVRFDASLAATTDTSYVTPHRGGDADLRLSVNWDVNRLSLETVPETAGSTCQLTPLQHVGTLVTAGVFAAANRYLRGDENVISTTLGTSISGIVLPSMFAFWSHGADMGTAARYAAASYVMETFPWSAALDMGDASRQPLAHRYHNRGSRDQDTLQMGMHLYRWQILPMQVLATEIGHVDTAYRLAPAIGAMGYQLGDRMRWGELGGDMADMVSRNTAPIEVGELITGAAIGYGLARTLECNI